MKTSTYAVIITVIALGSMAGNTMYLNSIYQTQKALAGCRYEADRDACVMAAVPVIRRQEQVKIVQAELLPPPAL